MNIHDRLWQRQAASLFEDRDQLVEFGAGVRACDNDPDGMKQFFAFCSAFSFHFIDNFFELVRSELAFARAFVFENFEGEPGEYGIGIRRREHFCVVGRCERGLGIVVEDERSFFWKLVESVDRRRQQLDNGG